jgi:MFS family permease
LGTETEMKDLSAGPAGISPPATPPPDAEPTMDLRSAGLATGALTDADETAVIRLPRIARALHNRDFRLFWMGNFLSNIGTWMQNIAQGWLVLQLTNSAFWLGVVGFASSAPILLFALIGGVIADHVNNRKLLMITQSAMMVFAFTMALLTFLKGANGQPLINVTEIILLTLGTGVAMSLNTPSYQVLVPRLVAREDLTNAIGLNSAQFNMSRVLGPTLGGFAITLVGAAGNFFLNGLSFLAVLVALSRMTYPERPAPPEGRLWSKLKEGFAYVFSHHHMQPLVLMTAIASLLAVPYLTFVPYFARDVLHRNAGGLGVLMACSGAGSFFGAITIAHMGTMRRRGVFVLRAGIGFFAAIIGFTFSHNFLLSGLMLMAAGYCMIVMVATVNSLLQHLADDTMRGRVMSIYSTAFLGLPPIGCLIAGYLAKVISPAHAIAGMSALAMIGSVAVFATKRELRELD